MDKLTWTALKTMTVPLITALLLLGCGKDDSVDDTSTTVDDTATTDTGTTVTDNDLDGVLSDADCDDLDDTLGDIANDADCDGYVTAVDCDDNDSLSTAKTTDRDCDGAHYRIIGENPTEHHGY